MPISRVAYAKLQQHAQANVLGRILGSLGAPRAGAGPEAAVASGYRAGQKIVLDLAGMSDRGHEDAQLFYERYGCSSTIAQRFFEQLDAFSLSLGSASLTSEMEKSVR